MERNLVYPVGPHELIYARINNAQAITFKFDKNEKLANKKIKGIIFHASEYITKTDVNDTLAAKAPALNKCFLTLKTSGGVERFNKVPLYMMGFGSSVNGTSDRIFPVDDLEIDLENSYVTASEAAIFTQGHVLMFSVFYEDKANVKGCK